MFDKTMDGPARLAAWREFRQHCSGTPEEIVEAFATIKPRSRYLDFYTPSSWPNVFDILYENALCQTGVTLVMAATLHHFKLINTPDVWFEAISNHITGNSGLILVHENECYNFLPGRVVDWDYAKANSTSFGRHFIAIDKLSS